MGLIFPALDADPLGICPQAEHGEEAICPRGKLEAVRPLDGGKDETLVVEFAPCPGTSQISQGLEASQGVVQAPACTAVQVEAAETTF